MYMRKINFLIYVTFCFLGYTLFVLPSCDKMDDIQSKFVERGEQVYLGKVDSIEFYPGYGSVKLTWYVDADPRIDQTIIYWNMRKDSVVIDFNRTSPGLQKDSIVLEDLPEGTSLFEFRNVNDEGETSLYSSASVTVWGPEFADGLQSRGLTGFDYNYAELQYNLILTPSTAGDSVIYSQIVYKNTQGVEKTIKIDRAVDSVELNDFPDGGEFRLRTVFFLPQGIDTVYADYQKFTAPVAVSTSGVKLDLKGSMDNQYFNRKGATVNDADTLYEWNIDGDLSIYYFADDESLTLTRTLPSVISPNDYKYFFFYDANRFIGIDKNDYVYMLQDVGDKFEVLETPGGGAYLGSGFHFINYMPARGFFYTLTPADGSLRTWFAKNDATWDSPNGTTVGTGFTAYSPLVLFNKQTLLGVDSEGHLWSFPISAKGSIGSKRRIGSGWNRFKKLVSVGTKLLAMEEDGDFYLFDNFDAVDKFWIVK